MDSSCLITMENTLVTVIITKVVLPEYSSATHRSRITNYFPQMFSLVIRGPSFSQVLDRNELPDNGTAHLQSLLKTGAFHHKGEVQLLQSYHLH